MLDPFTAFSAAGNVAQFVVYGAQIVSKGHAIHKSATGTLLEHENLSEITDDLSKIASGLLDFLAVAKSKRPLDEDEEALLQLCVGCDGIAQELLGALRKVMGQEKQGKWKSVRKALKIVWSKDEINNVERRLSAFRDQLALRILLQSKYKLESTAAHHAQALASLDASTQEALRTLANTSQAVNRRLSTQMVAIEKFQRRTESAIYQRSQSIRHDIIAASTKVENLADQNACQARQVLRSQSSLANCVDQANNERAAEATKLQAAMDQMRQEAEQQIKSLNHQVQGLHSDLRQLANLMDDSIKAGTKKDQERIRELSRAKTTAILAKEIFLERLEGFLELFKFNNSECMRDCVAQFSQVRLQLYPKPVANRAIRAELSLFSQIGYFLVSKSMSLEYPINACNVPMVKFFLENGVHQHLSDEERARIYGAALDLILALGPSDISERIVQHRNARKILEMMVDHGFHDSWLSWSEIMEGEDQENERRQAIASSEWLVYEIHDSPYALLKPSRELTDAVWEDDIETVQTLLNTHHGLCDFMDDKESTALTLAIAMRHTSIAAVLVANGSLRFAQDFLGYTPFSVAIQTGDTEAFDLLLKSGPCVHLDGLLMTEALWEIAAAGQIEMFETLLSGCSCPDDLTSILREAMVAAVQSQNTQMAEYILEQGRR